MKKNYNASPPNATGVKNNNKLHDDQNQDQGGIGHNSTGTI